MKKSTAFSAFSAAAVITLALSPVSPAISGCSYVKDTSGKNVRDTSKECVKTTSYKESARTVECGAEPPKVEEAPAPVAAPAPEPQVEAPAPVAPTVEAVDIKGSALFGLNSSKLSGSGKTALDGVIDQLRGFDKVKSITVTGHTDSTGSAAYNQKLSEKRANAVVNYLVSKGVNPALLTAVGMGETSPIADNKTKAGRAENRRVEIDIVGSKVTGQ
ncbi:MAG: OmpA family protein [bacterium]